MRRSFIARVYSTSGSCTHQSSVRHSVRQFSSAGLLCENNVDVTNTAAIDSNVDHARNDDSESSGLSRNAVSHSHRKAFCKWVTTKGLVHRDAPSQSGTNYLDGKSYPFPLNPQFQPKSPIASETRARIYEDWTSGLGIQQLSIKYGISLQRVEAILKLRQVESRWSKEGRQTMDSYSDSMASMLGAVEHNAVNYEQVADVPIDPGRQLFKLVPEAVVYTSKDAADDLGKVPFAERTERYIQSFLKRSTYEHRSAFAKLTRKAESDTILREPHVTMQARTSYTIKDSSSDRTVRRGEDGALILRTARVDNPQRRVAQSKWA